MAGFVPLKETLASLTASLYSVLTLTSIKLRCIYSIVQAARGHRSTSNICASLSSCGTIEKLYFVTAITIFLPYKNWRNLETSRLAQ
eukprot:1140362-Pelagomonas_calceolata.AAC.1